MKIQEIQTPAILVREGVLENNMRAFQEKCDRFGKHLWPMIKTHKSTELSRRQREIGADGFLCGTLDECEALCEAGFDNIMYAYPVAGEISCNRAAVLAKKCSFYVRLDGTDAAEMLNDAAMKHGVTINYTIIIDCGLHRFGVHPEKTADLARELEKYRNLRFSGISSHSGHVYGEADPDQVPMYAKEEQEALHKAVAELKKAGFEPKLVTTGSTPTFQYNVNDEFIQIFHPGNYIFNDAIQIGNGTAREEDCALVVYATVISHPREDLFICDAGAKCLGLDQGAHGNASVKGYGYVIDHPELTVAGLSEEVGKIHVDSPTDLKVGDRIMIIPNHACSAANLTDYLICMDEENNVVGMINVDIRGNKSRKWG